MVRQWLMDVDAGTVAEILLVFLMGCGGVGYERRRQDAHDLDAP